MVANGKRIQPGLVLVLAMVLVVLTPMGADAQVVVDSVTSSSADGLTMTFPHTVGVGDHTLLMVGIAVHAQAKVSGINWGTGTTACSGVCTPVACQCVLSQVATVTDGGKNVTVQLWKLLNPPPGTAPITVILPSSHRMAAGATSFFGVDHNSPLARIIHVEI